MADTITIRTEGEPANGSNFTFDITDNNGIYRFDASFANSPSDDTFTYSTPCAIDATGHLNASLNVLRLSADRRTPQLQIYDQSNDRPLYPIGEQTGDLIELIRSAYPENDFDAIHNYEIVFTYTGEPTDISVSISINGWNVPIDQNSELN